MGTLFYAPVGTDWGGEWAPLGMTDECGIRYEPETPETEDPALSWAFGGRCVRLTVQIRNMPASTYWELFRMRHPNLSRMRSDYRRRSKTRRR